MKQLASFQEEKHRYPVELLHVAMEDLQVIKIQRKPSKPHVKRLADSIHRIGFIAPLIVIESGGKYVIIDGQHRFLAAKETKLSSLPCLKIPAKYAHHLMELNVEKQMSLREKCYVALNVLRMYLEEEPSMRENDPRILDSIDEGFYLTLGLAYEKEPRVSGSAFEPLLKKVDSLTELALRDAMNERERRRDVLLSIHETVTRVVAAVKRLGISHPFLYKEILSSVNPYKRKRKGVDSFDGLWKKVAEGLRELAEHPEAFRRHRFSAAE